jgi:hypothetical protein
MRFVRKSEHPEGAPDSPEAAAEPAFIGLPDDDAGERAVAKPPRLWALGGGRTAASVQPPPAMDPADPLAEFSSETEAVQAPAPRLRWSRDRWLAVAATVLAIVEAVMLVRATGLAPSAAADGRLRVESAAGAEVLVNGVVSGPAPLELPLRPGRHKVQVRYAGVTREFAADVRAGGESHHFIEFGPAAPADAEVAATAGASGILEITSDPPGARVSVDGKAHGTTPVRLADLAPGEHDVVLANAAGSVTRRVRLTSGHPSSLLVSMPKASAATPGWVRVQSPVIAQIYESGELLGTTEVGRLMLPAGRHNLRLVNAALKFEQTQAVEVVPGQTRVLNVNLPSGLISINATPWAQVWIDGTARGETPIGNLSLPIGAHEIVLRHPQLGEQRRSVTVTLGGVTRVGVDLRR